VIIGELSAGEVSLIAIGGGALFAFMVFVVVCQRQRPVAQQSSSVDDVQQYGALPQQ
jgi:hypothetical protein